MSIALIVTRGFGNGTLVGTIPKVVVRGYTIPAAPTNVYSKLTRDLTRNLTRNLTRDNTG